MVKAHASMQLSFVTGHCLPQFTQAVLLPATIAICASCHVQWKGARILYLKLAQDPTSFAEFAEQLECQSCISKIIHMLKNPSKDPISVFALDVSASKSTQISRCTSMVRSVMQAQMARLLLSIILQLALADSVSLIQHIYKAGGLPLLRSLAMDLSEHTHPETEAAVDIKLLRQDIRAKLAQLYRSGFCICREYMCSNLDPGNALSDIIDAGENGLL